MVDDNNGGQQVTVGQQMVAMDVDEEREVCKPDVLGSTFL
jgi:hypothetical protein